MQVEIRREEDGRWLAIVVGLPGVMSYGATETEAKRNARELAQRVVAERLEHGESVPERFKKLAVKGPRE